MKLPWPVGWIACFLGVSVIAAETRNANPYLDAVRPFAAQSLTQTETPWFAEVVLTSNHFY